MALRERIAHHLSQPQEAAEIDWAHPLAAGLVAFALPGVDGWGASPVTAVPTDAGIGLKFVAASSSRGQRSIPAVGSEVTLFALANLATTSGNLSILSVGNAGSSRHLLYVGGAVLAMFSGGTGTGQATSATSLTSSVGITRAYCGRSSGTASRYVFIDGKLEGSNTSSVTTSGIDTAAIGGYYTSGTFQSGFYFDGSISLGLVFNRALSNAEIRELSANPWQLFKRRSWAPMISSGGVTLAVADTAHAHAADNVALTSSTALIVSNAAHAHAADNLTLGVTSGIDLVVSNAAHAHTSDNLGLSTTTWLAVADALHAHTAGNITLSVDSSITLTVANAVHAHATDNVALATQILLAVQSATHAHTADNVVLGGLGDELDRILKILSNRQELDPVLGQFRIYDNDGVTVLYQANAWEDAAGTIPYRGRALRRIDALT